MPELVGVHFDNAGKVAFLNTNGLACHINDKVIAQTDRGLEVGIVRTMPEDHPEILKKPTDSRILRIATKEDLAQEREIKKEEDAALIECRKKVKKHKLDMSLIDAQYTFDKKRITFFFLADERVDFRELVKDLASSFHTRIELRQVGVRDGSKVLGGIGFCGRPLCCATFLTNFAPVSIKMAKEQNLSLNPSKISGVCGRLMCCLKNEEDVYEELNKKLPRKGDMVKTPEGTMSEVASVDILREKVKVIIDDGDKKELKEYNVSELTYKKHPYFEEDEENQSIKLKKPVKKVLQNGDKNLNNIEKNGNENKYLNNVENKGNKKPINKFFNKKLKVKKAQK